MKCIDCPDYKACRRQNDLRRKRHKCKKANEPFVQTNADRIRAMSDEELAAYLVYHNPYSTEEFCLKWLRQPVKDGEYDG